MLSGKRLAQGLAGFALGVAWLGLSGGGHIGTLEQALFTFASPSFHRPTSPATTAKYDGVEPAAAPTPSPRESLREQAEDVVDYTLIAFLDAPAHVVQGSGTILWRNKSSIAVRELWVHLYLNAFKNERSLFLRAPKGSGRGTPAVKDWGYIDVKRMVAPELGGADLWEHADRTSPGDPDDQTDIRVPLPRDIAPGESLTLEVSWDSKLPTIVERTGYNGDFCLVAQWFPKIARLEPNGHWRHFPFYHLAEFYADFGTYDVSLDVPAGTVVGATGSRISASKENGRELLRYRQADVHDFAWTAWPRFREKTLEAEGVAIRVLYPPGYDAIAERELSIAAFGLRDFGNKYGRYPYSVLTIVHPPADAAGAGGMEYPTFITAGGAWYEPPFTRGAEAVTLHEFGHQYFYGLVATDEQVWPFLDEGINSFAEADGLGARFGAGSAFAALGVSVSIDAVLRLGAIQAAHNEPIGQPAQAFASGFDYSSLVYGRSATILGTLAGVYGRDALVGALGRYARRYRFQHPNAAEFIATVRETLGESAARNLEVSLFEKGWVDYAVEGASSRREDAPAGVFDRDGKRETVSRSPLASESGARPWRGGALVMRHGTLHFPVDVELWGADGSRQIVPWDGLADWVRVPYEGDSELANVVVDPEVRVTLDDNLLNNAYSVHPPARGLRTLEQLGYLTELALQALMP